MSSVPGDPRLVAQQERLTAIRQREQVATRGPWKADEYEPCEPVIVRESRRFALADVLSGDNKGNDGEFIAHAREDVPYLLDLVESQAVAIARLASTWQDIETAPKNGVELLLCGGQLGQRFIGRWDGYAWITRPGNHTSKPTHWQPLPAPPACAPGQGGETP